MQVITPLHRTSEPILASEGRLFLGLVRRVPSTEHRAHRARPMAQRPRLPRHGAIAGHRCGGSVEKSRENEWAPGSPLRRRRIVILLRVFRIRDSLLGASSRICCREAKRKAQRDEALASRRGNGNEWIYPWRIGVGGTGVMDAEGASDKYRVCKLRWSRQSRPNAPWA